MAAAVATEKDKEGRGRVWEARKETTRRPVRHACRVAMEAERSRKPSNGRSGLQRG